MSVNFSDGLEFFGIPREQVRVRRFRNRTYFVGDIGKCRYIASIKGRHFCIDVIASSSMKRGFTCKRKVLSGI